MSSATVEALSKLGRWGVAALVLVGAFLLLRATASGVVSTLTALRDSVVRIEEQTFTIRGTVEEMADEIHELHVETFGSRPRRPTARRGGSVPVP